MLYVRKEEIISYLEDVILDNTYTNEEYNLYCDYKLLGDYALINKVNYDITRIIVNKIHKLY